jgi:hypothetical protein
MKAGLLLVTGSLPRKLEKAQEDLKTHQKDETAIKTGNDLRVPNDHKIAGKVTGPG